MTTDNNFLAPIQLNINERQYEFLIKTLTLMETQIMIFMPEEDMDEPEEYEEKFTGHFNMAYWSDADKCGTVACIGGTSALLSGDRNLWGQNPENVHDLFYPPNDIDYSIITIQQASQALRNFLTTGRADWRTIMKD